MSKSQNGWPVLNATQTVKWIIPVKEGAPRHLILRPGIAGFVLVHFALWYHEVIEKINEGIWDDWGWAPRPIRGSSVVSNHASGTAIDLNATEHPLGVVGTLRFWVTRKSKKFIAENRINKRLKKFYAGVIRGGYSYAKRKDDMHFEIVDSYGAGKATTNLARKLQKTARGKRIMKANPHYRPV